MENNTKSIKVLTARLYGLMESEGYTASTTRDMKFILDTLASYMNRYSLVVYTPEIGDRFVAYCDNDLHICASRISRAKNIIGKLNRLLQGLDGRSALIPDGHKKIILPDGLMKSLADYLAYCANEGNRSSTIERKHIECGYFLKNLAELGCTEVRDMTGENVQAAFLAIGVTRYWQRIRQYLRFLFENDLLEWDFSGLVHHCRFPMPQPTVYSVEEISCLEKSFDLSSQNGIRNYAITLFMTRYGIRACDVAALTFENVDFANNRLRFTQQKTNEPWEGELLPEVKAALQNYIENVRPDLKGCSKIFITLSVPYAPIAGLHINVMIGQQFQNAKINISGKRHGSRALRSSIASNMINDGVPTEIIRNILGHETEYALKHYARIDMEGMRLCALSVPEPTGVFARMMSGKRVTSHV